MSSSEDEQTREAQSQAVWDIYSTKLHFPPTEEEEHLYGPNFIEDWNEVFNRAVWNTPYYSSLVMHVIIGQMPAVKALKVKVHGTVLDLRIHGCLFQDSGSGKGRGFNFASEMSEMLGLIYQSLTEVTDAALIGTIQQKKEYVPKQGEEITTEVVHGWLHESSGINIFAMNEAEVLFTNKYSQYARNAMTYFQIAMNTLNTPDCIIVKKLSQGDPIMCKPSGSFLLTSYLPENLYETIVRRGFLQRMVVVVNKITTEQRYDNALMSIDGLAGTKRKMPGAEVTKMDLADRLKIINRFYTTQKTFRISKGAREHFRVALDDLFEPLYEISIYQRTKLEEFVHRWLEIIYKLSFHHMILRMGTTLEAEDVAYAKNFLIPVWRSLTSFLEDSLVEPGHEKSKRVTEAVQAVEVYKGLVTEKFKDGYVPEPVLSLVLVKKWGVQQRTASDRIARLTYEEGIFKVVNKGMTPYLIQVKEPT